MPQEFIYLMKVNVALVIFYAFYRLFFYKDTFFKLRRAILLSFFGLALSYPLFVIPEWLRQHDIMEQMVNVYTVMLPEVTNQDAVTTLASSFFADKWIWSVAKYIYLLVVLFLSVRLIVRLCSLLRLAYVTDKVILHNMKIYALKEETGPFSFFKMIFLHIESHSEDELDEILEHENAHATQLHSIDIILGELFCMACWFNPFAWLLYREIRYNLEYLADNRVVQYGYDSKDYQYHLLGMASQKPVAALYNGFNMAHLKNRIIMMNMRRSPAMQRFKYLMFIPLVAFLVICCNIDVDKVAGEKRDVSQQDVATSNLKADNAVSSDPVFTVVEVMPEYPGGDAELLKFISSNVKYPASSKEKGEQGRVICSFIVNKDGSVSDYKIVRSISAELDAEAIRVLKMMPRWTPGKQNGKSVAVKYTVPVTFRLK